MHLGMAVQAGAREQEFGAGIGGQPFRQGRQAAMAYRRVAGLAQLRRAPHQEGRLIGAVRQMTDAAILGGRRMLPLKRPLLLGVAREAGLIQ